MDITWDIKASIEDREDGTQKFNAEFVKTKFKFKKCELLYNRIVPLKKSDLPKVVDDEEDDFDGELDELHQLEREQRYLALQMGSARSKFI